MLKNESGCNIDAKLQARCLISESFRMGIPNDIYFTPQRNLNDYIYVLYVIGHFIYTSLINEATIRFGKRTYFELPSDTQHELIEHRIKFYAFIQSIFGSPQRGWNKYVKIFLSHRWDNIKKMSHRDGYSAGIANSGKFKFRLNPSEKTKAESANIYSLITSSTGSELLIRNEADQLLRNKQYDRSRKKFIEYSNMAEKSGNTLNEIKGIVGYAYSNHMEGKTLLLPEALRQRYRMLVNKVEGKRWKEHFKYIEQVFSHCTTNT